GGGRKIVRIGDGHCQRQRDDEYGQRQFPGIGEAPHDTHKKALAPMFGVLGQGLRDLHHYAAAIPGSLRRPATDPVYSVAGRSTCSSLAPSPGNSPTVLPSAMTTMRSASASTSGRSEDTTSRATPFSARARNSR